MDRIALGLCHATSVAFDDKAVLIIGPSGSGKSSLGLQLMAFGAALISDDQTLLSEATGGVSLSAPPAVQGKIEARFIGILNAKPVASGLLHLVVDLGHSEAERLPPRRKIKVGLKEFELIYGYENPNLGYALLQWIKHGRNR